MNTSAFVLLLTFWLHGGMVTTKTITAPSLDDCNKAEPLIVQNYLSHKFQIEGSSAKEIEYIVPICLEVEKPVKGAGT